MTQNEREADKFYVPNLCLPPLGNHVLKCDLYITMPLRYFVNFVV